MNVPVHGLRLAQPKNDRLDSPELGLKEEADSRRMPASTHPLCFLSFKPRAVSRAVRKDAARRRDILSRVNIVKRIKIGGRWKMFSIPPQMPKATTTGTPSATAATMSSGTWAARAVV